MDQVEVELLARSLLAGDMIWFQVPGTCGEIHMHHTITYEHGTRKKHMAVVVNRSMAVMDEDFRSENLDIFEFVRPQREFSEAEKSLIASAIAEVLAAFRRVRDTASTSNPVLQVLSQPDRVEADGTPRLRLRLE